VQYSLQEKQPVTVEPAKNLLFTNRLHVQKTTSCTWSPYVRNTLHTLLMRVLETAATVGYKDHVTALQSVREQPAGHALQGERRTGAQSGEQKSRHV
jgi:hypothetical protein